MFFGTGREECKNGINPLPVDCKDMKKLSQSVILALISCYLSILITRYTVRRINENTQLICRK